MLQYVVRVIQSLILKFASESDKIFSVESSSSPWGRSTFPSEGAKRQMISFFLNLVWSQRVEKFLACQIEGSNAKSINFQKHLI